MKGCARTCLLWLLGWGIAAGAFYSYFVRLRDFGPPMFWAAVVAGLCVVMAVGYALGIGTAHRERKMLLEAMAGTPPPDGRWAAVSGTIQSMSTLTAPISGRDAVLYQYKIYRYERIGRSDSEVVYFEGKALAPSTIATRHGSVRLLSVPSLDDLETESVGWAEAVENAKAYLARTAFELRDTVKKRRRGTEEEWTDDDGEYRRDRRYTTRELELSDDFRFEEKRVGPGERVCAFGLYSRQRGGLIPHPNWSTQTRLMRGDTTGVAAQLRSRMVKYSTGVIVCSAIVVGIVLLYRYNALTAS